MGPKLGVEDPRLADRDWLAGTLERHGEMWIALELGVNRKTIRRRIETFGLSAHPPGRRRGVPATTPGRGPDPNPTAMLIVTRYAQEQRARVPPTEILLAGRIRAAQEARSAGDDPAYDDALLAIAAAAGLLLDHRRKVRAT